MQDYLYDAFISYRHLPLDKAVAKRLHTLIETYIIPRSVQKLTGKKKMGKVFRDEEELPLATCLSDNIQAALQASQWLIVICTPALLESRWCMFEIDYFLSLDRREHILLILADGTPATSFPPQLLTREEQGQSVSVEPLAANIVSDNTARSLQLLNREKLRILAPMLGVNFDDLKRRARQRKLRLAAVIAATALVIGLGTGIYISANQRHAAALRMEAEQQAQIAEAERMRAEEERMRAEEEQQQKEIERKNAVYNDLGERLEKAKAALSEGEKRMSADILLEALSISDANENMRHTELIDILRQSMYIAPFTVISRFNNQNVRINNITVSPDGTHAIGIVNNNSIAVIDLNADEILYQVSSGTDMIVDPCFSMDGSRFLARCDYGRAVKVWNTEDGSEAFTYNSLHDQQYAIANAFFWKDKYSLLVQDWDEFYLISETGEKTLFYTVGDQMPDYDPADNLIAKLIERPISEVLSLNNDDYTGMQILLSRDQSRVLISGRDGSTAAIILDDTGKRVSLLGVPADSSILMPGTFMETWSLSPDGKTAACISLIGILGMWDTDTGQLLQLNGFEYSDALRFSQIAFSGDSSRMAFTVEDQLFVADARTGMTILQATIDETSFVPSLAFNEDSKYLYLINQSLFVINTETWALELMENGDLGNQYSGVTPLSDSFLITRYDGTAYFYSTPAIASVITADTFEQELCEPIPQWIAGKFLSLHGEHQVMEGSLLSYGITDVSPRLYLARGGEWAALAYPDGAIELFVDGDESAQDMIKELNSPITALAMTETRLIASERDARLLIYDLEKRSVVSICTPGTSYNDFAFDPSGTFFMARTYSGMQVDVYDLDRAILLFSMTASGDTFSQIAFSADGAYAVAKTESGLYQIGNLWMDEDALLRQAHVITHTK